MFLFVLSIQIPFDQVFVRIQIIIRKNTNKYSNQKPPSPDDDNFERGNDNSFLEEFTQPCKFIFKFFILFSELWTKSLTFK